MDRYFDLNQQAKQKLIKLIKVISRDEEIFIYSFL